MKFRPSRFLEVRLIVACLCLNTLFAWAAQDPEKIVVAIDSTIELEYPDAPGDFAYQWLQNGSPVQDSDRVQGAQTPRLVITPAAESDSGLYLLRTTSTEGEENTAISFGVLVIASAPEIENVWYEVSGDDVLFRVAATGKELSYQWTWQGQDISGATRSVLTFTNGASTANGGYYNVRVSNIAGSVTGPEPGVLFAKPIPPGRFQGLFYDPEHAVAASSGFVEIQVSSSQRHLTGKARILGLSYPFSGTISPEHSITLTTSPSKAGDRLVLDLQFLTANGPARITGRVASDTHSWDVPFRANRSAYSSTVFAPHAGAYTLALANGNTPSGTLHPDGHGYGTLTVKTTGDVRLKGRTPDDKSIACAAKLAETGEWAMYVPKSKNTACLVGWTKITLNSSGAIPASTVYWSEPAGSPGPYAGGFDVALQALGSRFDTITGNLPFDHGVAVMAGGHLVAGDTPELDVLRVRSLEPGKWQAVDDPGKLKLTVKPTSGVLSGKFRSLSSGQASPVKGVLLQQQKMVYGYFIDPADISGSMTVSAGF